MVAPKGPRDPSEEVHQARQGRHHLRQGLHRVRQWLDPLPELDPPGRIVRAPPRNDGMATVQSRALAHEDDSTVRPRLRHAKVCASLYVGLRCKTSCAREWPPHPLVQCEACAAHCTGPCAASAPLPARLLSGARIPGIRPPNVHFSL